MKTIKGAKITKKGIVYLDFEKNRIIFHEIDEKMLKDECENDIYYYADVNLPSNACEWMLVDKDTNVIFENIIDFT